MMQILYCLAFLHFTTAAQTTNLDEALRFLFDDSNPVQQRHLRSVAGQLHASLTKRAAAPVFRQKLDEIARAYAEGYKAALLAVQARSLVPKLTPAKAQASGQAQALSKVPIQRSTIPQTPHEITVNAIEKSGIPRPQNNLQRSSIPQVAGDPNVHTMVQRSAPAQAPFYQQRFSVEPDQQWQQPVMTYQDYAKRSNVYHPGIESQSGHQKYEDDKRAQIEKLNYAARHRNVFLDSVGGDPYSGSSGVLSRQHFWLKKHRRESGDEPDKARKRRSRMPYLGQNLDKLGVVRAIFNYNEKPRRNSKGLGQEFNYAPMEPATTGVPVEEQQPLQYVARKSSIPRPYVPGPMQEDSSPITQSYPLESRSVIPESMERKTIEGLTDQNQRLLDRYRALQTTEDAERIKREHISKLNFAARHRNVYLDRMGGDPYGGASGVLTRQHILFKHKKRRSSEDEDVEEETMPKRRKTRRRRGMKKIYF